MNSDLFCACSVFTSPWQQFICSVHTAQKRKKKRWRNNRRTKKVCCMPGSDVSCLPISPPHPPPPPPTPPPPLSLKRHCECRFGWELTHPLSDAVVWLHHRQLPPLIFFCPPIWPWLFTLTHILHHLGWPLLFFFSFFFSFNIACTPLLAVCFPDCKWMTVVCHCQLLR